MRPMTGVKARATMRERITEQIKPMPFWQTLVFFGVPTLVAAAGQYELWPFFMSAGVSEETAYHYQALVVFAFLLSAALVAYVIEGNPLDWSSFRRRLRLFGLDRNGWKWTLGGPSRRSPSVSSDHGPRDPSL